MKMSPIPHDVVIAAAVLGQNFSLDDVVTVAGCSVDVALASLEEVCAARIVNEVPNAIDQFAFRPTLLREAVHNLMLNSRRFKRTLRPARFTTDEAKCASSSRKPFTCLSPCLSARAEDASLASLRAADAASAQLAFEEAARVFARATWTREP